MAALVIDKKIDENVKVQLRGKLSAFLNDSYAKGLSNEVLKAREGTIESEYLKYVAKTIDGKGLTDGVFPSGALFNAQLDQYFDAFFAEFFQKKELNNLTDLSLIEQVNGNSSQVTPETKREAIKKDLGVYLDEDVCNLIYSAQKNKAAAAAATNLDAVKVEVAHIQLRIERPLGLDWNGKLSDPKTMESDLAVATQLKNSMDLRAPVAGAVKDKDGTYKMGDLAQHLGQSEENNARANEREKMAGQYETALSSLVNREIGLLSVEEKADINSQIATMCRVLGIKRQELVAKMQELAGQEDAFKGDMWAGIKAGLSSSSKSTKKEYEKAFGKKTKTEDQFPIGSQFFAQALRECVMSHASTHVKDNKEINGAISEERRSLELVLGQESFKNLTDADKSAFIDDIGKLAEKNIPDKIFSLMNANINAEKYEDMTTSPDLLFSLLTAGGVDTEVIKLEKQMREKYKNIDFNQKIIFKDKEGVESEGGKTLGGLVAATFTQRAYHYSTAYMQDIAKKSKGDTKENKKFRKDANEVFNEKEVKKETGAQIEQDKGSKKSFKPISKAPYRALALAMKMINQLARMMTQSFQKTIGAGGFYNGISQEDFNESLGFGQQFERRSKDLSNFISGDNINAQQKQKLCDKLEIPDTALDELIKTQPKKVEDAIKAVGGLGYEEWLKVEGQEVIKERELKRIELEQKKYEQAKIEIKEDGTDAEKKELKTKLNEIESLEISSNEEGANLTEINKAIDRAKSEIKDIGGYGETAEKAKNEAFVNRTLFNAEIYRLKGGVHNVDEATLSPEKLEDIRYMQTMRTAYDSLTQSPVKRGANIQELAAANYNEERKGIDILKNRDSNGAAKTDAQTLAHTVTGGSLAAIKGICNGGHDQQKSFLESLFEPNSVSISDSEMMLFQQKVSALTDNEGLVALIKETKSKIIDSASKNLNAARKEAGLDSDKPKA